MHNTHNLHEFSTLVSRTPRTDFIAGIVTRGVTTAEKLRGTKVWFPTQSAPRPVKGQTGRWVWEGVDPSRCEGQGYHPRKNFLKTRMLNSGDYLL